MERNVRTVLGVAFPSGHLRRSTRGASDRPYAFDVSHGVGLPRSGHPPFHYMVAVAGGRDVRCCPYATFGTQELSDHALTALEGRKACLLGHHGVIATGSTLQKALSLAIEIETLARMYLTCLTIGEPTLLPDDEMELVLEKFDRYGQARPA